MTHPQRDALSSLFSSPRFAEFKEFHHGCCIGADYQAVALVKELTEMVIVARPGCNANRRSPKMSYRARNLSDHEMDMMPYLERNVLIVEESDLIIGAPRSKVEELRSGTWATIRACRKREKAVMIIWPDGTVEER